MLTDLAEKCSRQISRFVTYLQTHPQAVREAGVDYDV